MRVQLERDALYAQYIDRQKTAVEALRRDEDRLIPGDFNYSDITGLSNEVRSKLERVRPSTLAQASRIEGVTPAALTLVLSRLRTLERRKSA